MGKVEPLLELTTLLKAERAKSFGACFTSKSYAKSQTISRKFFRLSTINVCDTSPSGLGEKSTQVNK